MKSRAFCPWPTRKALASRALLLGVFSFLFATNARAFRTGTDLPELSETPRVAWSSGHITFELTNQAPPGLLLSDLGDQIREAMFTWSSVGCTSVDFDLTTVTDGHAQPNDGRNTIEWVTSGWAQHGRFPDGAGAADVAYDKGADGSWRIVEADIYLNAESDKWTLRDDGTGQSVTALSVMTHEIGHALGLLHSCEHGGVDGAPDCDATSDVQATMYPDYSPSQSVLDADAVAAACFLYPVSDCASTCADGQTCTKKGCATPCGSHLCLSDETCTDESCVNEQGCVNGVCPLPDADAGACPTCGLPRYMGEPCETSTACVDSVCNQTGICAKACESDEQCKQGEACTHGIGGGKGCSPQGKEFGEACASADDCSTGQCVAGAEKTPVCTRLCGDKFPECPAHWTCGNVEDRLVCAPDPVPAPSCRASLGASPPPMSAFASAALVALISLGRRSSRRRPHAVRP